MTLTKIYVTVLENDAKYSSWQIQFTALFYPVTRVEHSASSPLH